MNLELFFKIAHFQILLSMLVVLMAVFPFRRSVEAKFIGLISLVAVITFYGAGLISLRGKDINYANAVYNIVSITIFILLYEYTLHHRYRKLFITILAVFLFFAFFNLFFWQKNDINTYSHTLGSFILTALGVIYLYRLLVDLPVKNLRQLPMFWFNTAVLMYGAGTLFIFLFASYLTHVLHNNLLIYWTFHNVLNIVKTLGFIFGLWLDIRIVRLRPGSPSVP